MRHHSGYMTSMVNLVWLWMTVSSCNTFRMVLLGSSCPCTTEAFSLVHGPSLSWKNRNELHPGKPTGGRPLFGLFDGMWEAIGSTKNGASDIASLLVTKIEYNETTTTTTTTKTETETTETETTKTTTMGGYQRIEEWHEENQDSEHVLRHLKQEKARWAKTFDDLS